MASGPMQKCCIAGVLHEGTPTGSVQTIGNTKAYITYPPSNSTENALLLLTDVYGFTFPNTRLIADAFASAGYFTIIPDLFNGAEVPFPPPQDFDLQEYIGKTMPRVGNVDPIIESVIRELRADGGEENEGKGGYGVKRLGGVGYCFGGKYVCRWLKGDSTGLDAGFVAHPSFVDASEIANIAGPLSIAAAESDQIFTPTLRHKTEEILSQHSVPWQLFLYGDVEHGFAVKGHMGTKKARFAKEQAFGQALGWFEEYVKEE